MQYEQASKNIWETEKRSISCLIYGPKKKEPKNFDVKIYYSSFCAYQVKAENENKAIKEARKLKINNCEIFNNLENWKDADTAEEINYAKKQNF